MRLAWLAASAVGLVIAAASIGAARRRDIPEWEVRVFHAVNRLPGWLYWILWPPMQLGNLVVGTLVGLAIAWLAREPAVAVGVILAMILKLVTERIVRREMRAYLAVRERPGSSQDGAVLRGDDVPAVGASFPSGHVILVAAISCVVAPTLPAAWLWVPFLLTALVMLGRVYVGAHNPLDVTAGLGAGLLLGGVVAGFVG
jgi:membrane-associated phospholipid phosphatase